MLFRVEETVLWSKMRYEPDMDIQRILLTINVRWWNAEAAYAVNVARGLIQNGKEVWLLVNKNSPVAKKAEKLKIPVVDHINLDSKTIGDQFRNFKALKHFIGEHQIQLVNAFKSNGSFLFPFLKKSFPDLIFIKTRGEARPPKRHFLNRYVYGAKGCDGVITVGQKVQSWIEALELPLQKIKTIYYGDTPVEMNSHREANAIKEELGIEKERHVMALLGRTQRVKGHMLLLQALTLLKQVDLHLLFLVKDLEEYPEELEEIKDFIQRHGLEKRVSILGFQKKLGEVMSIIEAGVIPSTASEVNCRVAVEFLSCSIPVVSFATGTLPEVITHGDNGYICEDKTAPALARCITDLFGEKQHYLDLKEKALHSYEERFTLDTFYKETMAFYTDCAEN